MLARTIRWTAVWAFAVTASPWSSADEDRDPLDLSKASISESNASLGPSIKPLPAWISGWVDLGYTASTVGSGRLLVEPRPNHLGNEFLLN
ncbi:MAG: hypothetical protein FJ308_01450 [Planctomycetes bacterium]|nr:hypothetical protein [Planctomycetota bacterium]